METEPTAESLTEWIARTGAHAALRKPRKNNPNNADWPAGSHHWTVTLRNDAGRIMTVPFSQGSAHKDPPTAFDVLSCLAMDAGTARCATFEEWAADLGCDPDSRKAERTFRAVERQTLALREWAGPDFESLTAVDVDR